MKTKQLVVDTAAFVKNLPLWEYGEEFYSVPEIIAELRDKATRERYAALPVTITMRQPQPWAMKFINQFSKKTGDSASLSLADVKILALTYELEVEARGSSAHLRSEPQKPIIEGPSSKAQLENQQNVEGFHLPSEKCGSLTNPSDILPTETLSEDIDNHFFDDYSSDVCDDTDLDVNQGNDLPVGLASLPSNAFNDCAPVSEETVNIFWCHMLGLENDLGEHSYVGGHSPTSDDCNVYEVLAREYPQFRPPAKDKHSSFFFERNLHSSDIVRPLHSTFPCIRRWSYHMSSFSAEERNQFPSSGRSVGKVLCEFGERGRNRDESSKAPELMGQKSGGFLDMLEVDISRLSLANQYQPSEKGIEEGDENGSESDGFHQGLRENGLVEEDSGSHTEEFDEEEEDVYVECENGYEESENMDSYHQNELDENENEEEEEEEEEEEDDDDDDEEGWITPANIKRHKLRNKQALPGEEEKEEDVLVACVTSDFAIQNMLKHIGLSVMGVDGKLVRQIRTYILRCYACFKICSDMSKIFCPKCGNKTLKRVSVTVNPDGTQKIWINFKKPINTKGMRFPLPRPRGGQHARNPILVADQREVRQFSTKSSKKKINPLHEDYNPDGSGSPFAVRDVYSRAAQLGYMGGKCHNHYYWEQKNPNARVGKSKKKK